MTKSIKVFTKDKCPLCPTVKQLGAELQIQGHQVSFYDVEKCDGMAEASFYTVMSTPSLLVVDADEDEIHSWRGTAPTANDLARYLN